jgi:hypothetical protein
MHSLPGVLNAFVVLPLLGEGIAGARLLTVLGMMGFAIAHTAFFIILTLSGLRVLTVLRLMMNSNFVVCKTGRSAGFSPLRIRAA